MSSTSAQSEPLKVGIIGTGRPHATAGSTGWGMSRLHARGYQLAGCRLVALADISQANAEAFAKDVGGERIYTDYRQMLRDEKLDIVSIATWPGLHHDMVIAAAEAGVRAVHCEKPMAPTFGASRHMAEVCAARNCQLTINHQRRFNAAFVKGKELLRQGAIGTLQRMEGACANLFDWGTHWFDMMNFLNDDQPVRWVLGQVELRGTHWVYNAPCEGQGICYFHYANGVHGYVTTGQDQDGAGGTVRLIGSDGQIAFPESDGTTVRLWGRGENDWRQLTTADPPATAGPDSVARGVGDVVQSLREGRESQLSARRALAATELIFATYESARRRGRVDLPLTIDDSPLQTMLDEAGIKQ